MAGAEINFVCPIDEIGDENGYCTWAVTCYSGDKINIKVPANEIHVYCLERGSEIRKTSVYGIVNDFNKNITIMNMKTATTLVKNKYLEHRLVLLRGQTL